MRAINDLDQQPYPPSLRISAGVPPPSFITKILSILCHIPLVAAQAVVLHIFSASITVCNICFINRVHCLANVISNKSVNNEL